MEKDKIPKPPIAGIVYGNIAYWLAIVGVIIAVGGMVIYLTSGGYLNKASIFENIWRGDTVQNIWAESTGRVGVPHGYWYLKMLAQGDCLAMLGIAFASFAGVIGMWGAFIRLLHSKGGIYVIFTLIVAVILTLSAWGILNIQ